MGTTPLAALPYWELGDPPNGPSGLQVALLALEKKLVLTFADATARNAAITSPVEGMVAYLTTPDQLTIYSAGAWVIIWEAWPRCRARRITSTQNVTTATFTAVQLNGEDYDTASMHSTVTNTERLVATEDGLWRIDFLMTWGSAAGGGDRYAFIAKNTADGSTPADRFATHASSAAAFLGASGSIELPLVANDYVKLMVWQNSGSTHTVAADTTYMSMRRVA